MLRFALCLAAALLIASPATARTWFPHGVGGSPIVSPVVTPGGSPPTVNAGSAAGVTMTATYNSITPVVHGSSGDYGYGLGGVFRWDAIPFVEYGKTGANTVFQVGLFTAHPATNAQKTAGAATNIIDVKVRCDGGFYATITGQTANANAGNVSDWNFTGHTADWPDGIHKCDAVAEPTTGPDIIAEGPGIDQYGNLYEEVKIDGVSVSNTAGGSGHILTVPASPNVLNFNGAGTSSSVVSIGQSVTMYGAAPNTFIDGDSTHNQTSCTSESGLNCSGTGRAGTYHVTQPQNTAANPAQFGVRRSYYFITNYNGTLYRPKAFFSLAGNDSTGNGTSGNPYLTMGKAMNAMAAADSASFHKGLYGATVCAMGGSTYTYSGIAFGFPDSSLGWTTLQGADQAPCSLGGDPGNPSLQAQLGINDRAYFTTRTMWRYLTMTGPNAPTDASPGSSQYLAADHVTAISSRIGYGGLLGSGGAWCVESTSWFGQDGACSGALMTRNVITKYLTTDCQHDVPVIINMQCGYAGPQFFWALGDVTNGSNVITNVHFAPSELSGVNPANVWVPAANPSVATNIAEFGAYQAGVLENLCFPAVPDTLYVIAATSTTLSVGDVNGNPVNANLTCTAANLAWPGSHGDNAQWSAGVNFFSDIVAIGNDFGAASCGVQQGQFVEAPQVSGLYFANNRFCVNVLTGEHVLNNKGGNENYISSLNTFINGGGPQQDLQQSSNGETYVGDQCINTGQILPVVTAGTNIRALAAASNTCYSTTTP